MTIDERLEALTHSVELLAEMQKATEKELRRTDKQLRRLGNYIHTVAQVVLDHEGRLRGLEGDNEDQESDEEES